jgi:hypothetical protein
LACKDIDTVIQAKGGLVKLLIRLSPLLRGKRLNFEEIP